MEINVGDIFYVANNHKYVVSKVKVLKLETEKVHVQTFINDTDLNPIIFDIYLKNVNNSFFKTELEAKASLGADIYHSYKKYLFEEKDIPICLNYTNLTMCYKTAQLLVDCAEEFYPEKLIGK